MTRALKYAADRVTGALLLLLLSPVLLGIALWIVADSGRPALIRQQRAGKNGKPFGTFKFRTMVRNAVEEARKMQLADPFGVVKDDPRITNPGRILRRTGLDELPQLLNVVIGQMSLVGPRPALPNEAERYGRSTARRLLVKPGITGLWQVSGRSDLSWEDSVRLDLYYVENWSFAGDIQILWKTLSAVVRGHGAY